MESVEVVTDCPCNRGVDKHASVHLRCGEYDACIDELLVPVIVYLWSVGINTRSCCQGLDAPLEHMASITFSTPRDLEQALAAFAALAAEHGEHGLWLRATLQRSGAHAYSRVGEDVPAHQVFFTEPDWQVTVQTTWWMRFALARPMELPDPAFLMYALDFPVTDLSLITTLLPAKALEHPWPAADAPVPADVAFFLKFAPSRGTGIFDGY